MALGAGLSTTWGNDVTDSALNLMSFNLCWTTTGKGRLAQPPAVSAAVDELGGGPAVAALQEVSHAGLTGFKEAGWEVLASTRPVTGRLGVAIVGRGVEAASEPLTLDRSWFEVEEVYPELAQWFAERSVAVDLAIGGTTVRFGSFHATPGSSRGPKRMGVGGARKPWYHRRVADWVATWPRPYAFAIDANSPHSETADGVRYFLARGDRCEAGEDDLLGVRAHGNPPRHDADDLLRTWMSSAHGRNGSPGMNVDPDGPLWVSHYTRGGKPKRFDHIWATPELEPRVVKYWPLSRQRERHSPSDHALVGARVALTRA